MIFLVFEASNILNPALDTTTLNTEGSGIKDES